MNIRKITISLLLILFGICLISCNKSKTNNDSSSDNIVEVLYVGWNNIAIEEDYDKNPYKKYIDETYGIDYRVSLTSDLQTELAKRFASSKSRKPDIILFKTDDFTSMKTLYNQGFFISDYTKYLDDLPKYKEVLENSVAAKAKLTENNKIIALTLPEENPTWMHKIRKDWVEKYAGGKIPETVDELLEMAANVKADNSKHYLFTGSGQNKGFDTLEYFQYMFSDYNDWYVENNTVSHPILDGSRKKFLDFLKTLYQNGYIDPNFYTQDWTQKKINVNNGSVGIDWYPPSIATEYVYFNNNDESKTDIWLNMPMPTDTVGVTRGAALTTFNNYIVISSETEKNTEKMEKIMRFLNDMLYPEDDTTEARTNSLYMKIRWGLEIDGYEYGEGKEIEPVIRNNEDTGFVTYYYQKNPNNHTRNTYGGSWDYGVLMSTQNDKVIEYLGATKYGNSAYNYIDLYNGAVDYYKTHAKYNYGEMLNVNAKIQNTLDNLKNEFEIRYVLGTNTMSYEEFVDEWLNYGGSTIKTSVEQQFKKAGLLK